MSQLVQPQPLLAPSSRPAVRQNAVAIVVRVLVYTVLIVAAVSMLVPFVWMVFTSFKPEASIFRMPPEIITLEYTLAHYLRALTRGRFNLYFMNSLIVATTATVLNVLLNAMAGYAFARLRWRLRETFFIVVLAVMMLPGLIALIPTFLIVKWTPFAGGNNWLGQGGVGWLDSYAGLILPSIGNGFYVFLLRQFFLTLPSELEDAARVDGASEASIFWRIILPLSGAVLAVVAIFSFQAVWNDFLWPLVIVQSDKMRTIQLGLTLFRSQHRIEWGVLMAGTTIATLPTILLFLLAQRYFVQGIALTGIKG
ncbi:MAG: ABC transporter permease [Chloroflexi bacterium]|nr:MAG: ABC transporter permease [Chloroflexota bacterium]